MDVIEAILARHSVRNFSDKPVEKDIIRPSFPEGFV